MATVEPFKGMRYTKKAGDLRDLTSPPYDIISADEQKKLHSKTPYNIIRLEYGEEFTTDDGTVNKYSRAKDYLSNWLNDGILDAEGQEAFYIYEQIFTLKDGTKKSLKGIICTVKLEEFSKEIVLPHEETLSKAKTDRFNLMSATDCNFSQIYSLYMDEKGEITPNIKSLSQSAPDISFIPDDGIVQKLWIIKDKAAIDAIVKGFADKQLFIADGHHRYETALNYSKSKEGDGLHNYVMMFLTDMEDDGLVVFPTHRLLSNLADFDVEKIVNKAKENFVVEKILCTSESDIENVLETSQSMPTFGFYAGGDSFYKMTLKDFSIMDNALPNRDKSYKTLDVSVLHTLILDQILGIDMENMANQKNLTYTKVAKEAFDEVKNRAYQGAFLLNATKVSQIKDVSLAKEKMPQKSTYFWPKLVTGIVMNNFNV